MRIFFSFLLAMFPYPVFSSTHVATEFYIDCVDMWAEVAGSDMTDEELKKNKVLMGNKDTDPFMLAGSIACKIDKLEKGRLVVLCPVAMQTSANPEGLGAFEFGEGPNIAGIENYVTAGGTLLGTCNEIIVK